MQSEKFASVCICTRCKGVGMYYECTKYNYTACSKTL